VKCMTPMQSTVIVLFVSAAGGFFLASVLLPATAPTRLGGLCFWLARLLIAASVAVVALGVLEVANSELDRDAGFVGGDANRALLARSVADVLYAGSLAGWGLVVQAIGMSSFAWREFEPADNRPATGP
jgi:hypothetical protein